jgi:hypothetical protein
MKNQLWPGLDSQPVKKKKIGADYEQLLRAVFSCFHGHKIYLKMFWEYCSFRTKKVA